MQKEKLSGEWKDDGRTIADMSFWERGPAHQKTKILQESKNRKENHFCEEEFTSTQRKWAILGAMKASFLIGLAYMGGLAVVVVFMILLWKIL